ncbi:extensin-like domain-containing protein [Pseudomonas sp. Gutcm_11s]|uniref:extensin-like domain-containing protein n=1 Tax=Pseudomonas sp. Gutcm_11s TaxID=3026088 RepID=UPI00235F2241|nr:extensin family protein [Pseudomonas sp. Gutcm_11s]MDD0841864.1 extensin family protein [Pseudomonas sp. Gutcm_11s]
MRVFWPLVLLSLMIAPLAVQQGWVQVSPRLNPWAPLDVRQPPNLLTGYKLMRLQRDPELCRLALDSSVLRYTAVADSEPAAGCAVQNSVRVDRSAVQFSSSFLASCRLAVAYALFEEHGLQPAARRAFGQPVARVDHLGSFACRNIGNSQRRSQHATANALDIAGFRLQDGRRISVARHWAGKGPEALFLREVRDAACDSFRVTLGPEYNAAHRDHLHLDMGLFRLCR